MMPELKPCPFCGGAAESYQATERKPNPDGSLNADWVVDCSGCDCNMEGAYKIQEDAILLWNTRPDGGDSLRKAATKLLQSYSTTHLHPDHKKVWDDLRAALAAKDGE